MTSASPPSARLTRGALSSVVADLCLAAASLLAAPVMVRALGPTAFGIYVLVTVLGGQLGVLQFGLAPAITRRMAEGRARGDTAAVRATEQAAWVLALASAVAIAAAFLAVGPSFFARTGGITAGVLAAAVAAVAVQPLAGASQAMLLGRERFAALAGVRLVQGVLRSAVGVAVVLSGRGLAAVLLTQAAIDLAASGAAAILARDRSARPSSRVAAGRALLGLGLPFAASSVLAGLLVDGEKIVIGWARSLDQLTYYAVPYAAVLRLAIVPAALATVLAPRLSALAASGLADEAARMVRRTTRVTAAVLIAAAAPLAACAPEWLSLWLGADFAARAAPTTRLLLVAMVVNGVASPACTVVRAGGRPVVLVLAYAIELPLHLAAVYLLVRGWGITGAAAAWLLRAALDGFVQRALAARVLGRALGGGTELALGLGALLALALAVPLLGPAWWSVRLSAGAAVAALALARGLDRDDWSSLRLAAGRPVTA